MTVAAAGLAATLYLTLRPSGLHLIGVVDAEQIIVSAQVPGRIERLRVEEGQEVQQGDLLAILEDAELSATTASSVAQATSLASQVEAARATAASTVGELAEGLAAARASYDMALAALAEAAANRKRQEVLTQRTLSLTLRGAVSMQDRDTAVGTLEALEAHERSAAKGVEQARAGVKAAQARCRQGRAACAAAKAVSGQLSAAQAQVAGAQARLGFTRIHAPTRGRVGTVVARPGEFVAAGAPVLTLLDLAQTWVYVAVPETEADRLQVADRVQVGMPSGARVEGRVLTKAVEADFATQRDGGGQKRDIRAVRFKLLIENPGGSYVPGMTAEVTLGTRRKGTQ